LNLVAWAVLWTALWITAAVPLAAQAPRWRATGPRRGIASLATAAGGAGVVWAVAYGRAPLRSLDGGASWTQPAVVIPYAQDYFAVATDPVDPLIVYAEGFVGLARTSDGGATWSLINSTSVGAFAIAPSAPRTLYLARYYDYAGNPLSRSDDGGATWRALPALPPGIESIFDLAVDPSDPNNVYAQGSSTSGSIFLHSTDGGGTWLTGSIPGYRLSSLQIDPRGALYGVAGPFGSVRSRDGGQTWEYTNAGLPYFSVSVSLVRDRTSGNLYLATSDEHDFATLGQVWRSADGGTTWTELVERSGLLYPLALDGALPGRLYVGTEDGLLASADAGQHWQLAGAGFLAPRALDLAVDSQLAGTLYAVLETPLSSAGLRSPSPRTRLARTTDGGGTWTSWTPRDQDGAPISIQRVVADPFTAGSLYSSAGPVLYHSSDGGKNWRSSSPFPFFFLVSGGGLSGLAADPFHAGVLFAAGFLDNGTSVVLRSANGGQSWTTVLGAGQPSASTLLVDPTSPGTVFAGGRGGFWRSLDGGLTWASIGPGPDLSGQQWVVGLQTDAGHNLYAELGLQGAHTLYRSADRGTTWSPIDSGPLADVRVNDLLVDSRGTALYVGTSNGVYVSQDGGAHWTAASDGITADGFAPYVFRLAADPAHAAALIAATEGGLFASPRASACIPSDLVLCLAGGKFAARVHWSLPNGTSGGGSAAALTDRSGSFWFFSPGSLELTLKMIDGQTVNHHFWLFGADLTDVAYTLTVTEVATGAQRTYSNPGGHFGNFADTSAFEVAGTASTGAAEVAPAAATSLAPLASPLVSAATSGCVPAADTLCLAGSRFAVRVTWSLPATGVTSAVAVPLVQNTGAFWFFSPQLPELTVKVLDGRPVNGHFWVFLAGLSDINYTTTVTDTVTGATKHYVHPAGTVGSIADTSF
jgi:photosystem II stability/assembly factor-like uncharacterized protein